MSVSRRQFIESGAAAGLLAVTASSPLLASMSNPPAPQPLPTPLPAQPIQRPRVMVDPIVDPRLVTRARVSFDRHRASLTHTDFVGITDFSRASREPRFYILNTATGQVSAHRVCHGRGSDPAHTGFVQQFSNGFGSHASSNGAYVTGAFYEGQYGRSLRLRGLDHSNNNAEARAIVVHSAWYAEPDVIHQHGRLGRSEGCFAFSYSSLQEVLTRLGPGRLIYADKV